jgi:RHS repeat-associated protein
MFFNTDGGLYLTQYRAYDPVAGRWLSRDPIGESSDPTANLYAYVAGNPVSLTDASGQDITVILYEGAGGEGHIGIGVAPSGQTVAPGQTSGFYPAPGYGVWGGVFGTQGVLQQDTGHTPMPNVANTVVIPTNSAQDAQVRKYLNNLLSNPPNYSVIGTGGGKNCAMAAEDALGAAGINVPQTIFPVSLMQSLQASYGGGNR